MGIQDLQTFIESGSIPGSCVPVDIVKIGRSFAAKAQRKHKYAAGSGYQGQLALVVSYWFEYPFFSLSLSCRKCNIFSMFVITDGYFVKFPCEFFFLFANNFLNFSAPEGPD